MRQRIRQNVRSGNFPKVSEANISSALHAKQYLVIMRLRQRQQKERCYGCSLNTKPLA